MELGPPRDLCALLVQAGWQAWRSFHEFMSTISSLAEGNWVQQRQGEEGLCHSQQHASPPLFANAPVDASPSTRQLCLAVLGAYLDDSSEVRGSRYLCNLFAELHLQVSLASSKCTNENFLNTIASLYNTAEMLL